MAGKRTKKVIFSSEATFQDIAIGNEARWSDVKVVHKPSVGVLENTNEIVPLVFFFMTLMIHYNRVKRLFAGINRHPLPANVRWHWSLAGCGILSQQGFVWFSTEERRRVVWVEDFRTSSNQSHLKKLPCESFSMNWSKKPDRSKISKRKDTTMVLLRHTRRLLVAFELCPLCVSMDAAWQDCGDNIYNRKIENLYCFCTSYNKIKLLRQMLFSHSIKQVDVTEHQDPLEVSAF